MQLKEDSGKFIAINFSLVNEASNAIASGLINDTSAIPLLSSDEIFVNKHNFCKNLNFL